MGIIDPRLQREEETEIRPLFQVVLTLGSGTVMLLVGVVVCGEVMKQYPDVTQVGPPGINPIPMLVAAGVISLFLALIMRLKNKVDSEKE